MMYLIVRKSGQSGELYIQGSLAGGEVVSLKLYLQQASYYVTDLTVDCTDVTGVDAACLQVLCSAYRRSRQQLRTFTLRGHAKTMLLQAAQSANYAHCIGCDLENEHRCILGVC